MIVSSILKRLVLENNIYIENKKYIYLEDKNAVVYSIFILKQKHFFPHEFAYRNHFFLGVSGVSTLCAHIKRRLVGAGV